MEGIKLPSQKVIVSLTTTFHFFSPSRSRVMPFRFQPMVSLPTAAPLGSADRFRWRTDGEFSYLVTPDRAWRGPLRLEPDSELLPLKFPEGEVQNFHVIDGAWYLLKEPAKDGRVLLRSRDQGATWEPLDDGLEVDEGDGKTRLMPTRMAVERRVLFSNAGGGPNFMSSPNDGKTWNLLFGMMKTQMAYAGKLLVRGRTALLGGEAPLDDAYLRRGELREDLSGWAQGPVSVEPMDIGNRNVQFIEASGESGFLFAGVEGGLLKSTDDGRTWRWVQQFGEGESVREGQYPYIQQVCFGAGSKRRIWAGGFDKVADSRPYLSVSEDGGETWADVSKSLGAASGWQNILAIHEDSDGRGLVGTFDSKKGHIVIGSLNP